MKTIIITGSNGFIGSNLVNALSQKYKILLLLRFKKKGKKPNYEFSQNISFKFFKDNNELYKKAKNINADCLIHCATHYVKNHKINDINKIINSNIEFGTILLDNLKNMKIKKFINFSTIWENYNGILNNPLNLYSASKQSFEKIVNYYQLKNKKTSFYNLFISDTYGENDKRKKLISILKKNITNKKETKIISKNLFINLLYVKDIINGVKILLEKKIKPGKYSLINEKSFKISELILCIKKKEKIKIKIKWLSSKIIKEKIYKYKSLPHWKSKSSDINQMAQFILKNYKT